MRLSTRLRIVAWETVFIGAFLLAVVALQLSESSESVVGSFAWVYGIIGVTAVLVGLEAVALTRHLPGEV